MKEKSNSTGTATKKEIRSKIKDSINAAIGQFEKGATSKKIKKVVQKTAKKLSVKIKKDLKKIKAKTAKSSKKINGQLKEAVVS